MEKVFMVLVPAISMTTPVNCSDLLCGVAWSCLYTDFFSFLSFSFLLCSAEVQDEVLVPPSSKSFVSLHQQKWLRDLRTELCESLL
jgi:hypothetical protein